MEARAVPTAVHLGLSPFCLQTKHFQRVAFVTNGFLCPVWDTQVFNIVRIGTTLNSP